LRLAVDQVEFKYYNGFIDGIILNAGDWVLVPRMGSPTP
jgi:hypothetical protein